MKKTLFGAVAAAMFFGGAAFGQTSPEQTQPGQMENVPSGQMEQPKKPEQQANNIEGKVENVKKDHLTIKGQAEPLYVDSSSTIMRDGKVVALKELKKGDDVRASFDLKNGKRVATTITAESPQMMKEQKKSPQPGQPSEQQPGSSY